MLEFTPTDVETLSILNVQLDIVYSRHDQLIPWASERVLLDIFGIDSPEEVPPAGTVLQNRSGRVRVFIAEGDHYLPLKQPRQLREFLQ